MIIPYDKLSPEALQGIIEQFVSRDGIDSGRRKGNFGGGKNPFAREIRPSGPPPNRCSLKREKDADSFHPNLDPLAGRCFCEAYWSGWRGHAGG